MASIKRGAIVASTLMLIAAIASACNQPYSQQPSVTNTPKDPNSLFATPIGQTPSSMGDVETFGTGTALALSGTPVEVATQTAQGVIPGTPGVAATATPLIAVNATATLAIPGATSAVSGATSGPLPTSVPVGVRPASYTLQKGEFPYCIARRFDVNPQELLSLNGLSSAQATSLSVGKVLTIPQSGSFPPPRALTAHPATYTVKSSGETIYSVACLYGDVDPGAIASANNLTQGTALTSGQQLSIP